MSNEVIDINQADRIKAELLRLSKQVAPPSSNKISTRGKVFTAPGGASGPGPIKLIVLDFVSVNSFYEGVYNQNVKTPPACFAVGQEVASLAPSTSAPKPQASSCGGCKKNEWKSAASGNGKACKNTYRLLVLPPDFNDGTEAMTLYVSPTGLKNWDAYVRRLAAEHTARPIDAVTEVRFDPNQTYPKLLFAFAELNSNVAAAERIRARCQDQLFREPDVQSLAA